MDDSTKEMHLKLEKKLSSPVASPVGVSMDSSPFSPSPPAHSWTGVEGLGIEGSPPPDQEDLEVQMINESFEEQQKRQKMYESQTLKELFYSFPNAAAPAPDEKMVVEEKPVVHSTKVETGLVSSASASGCINPNLPVSSNTSAVTKKNAQHEDAWAKANPVSVSSSTGSRVTEVFPVKESTTSSKPSKAGVITWAGWGCRPSASQTKEKGAEKSGSRTARSHTASYSSTGSTSPTPAGLKSSPAAARRTTRQAVSMESQLLSGEWSLPGTHVSAPEATPRSEDSGHSEAMDQLSMEMAEKVLSDLDDELISPSYSNKADDSVNYYSVTDDCSANVGVDKPVEENLCGTTTDQALNYHEKDMAHPGMSETINDPGESRDYSNDSVAISKPVEEAGKKELEDFRHEEISDSCKKAYEMLNNTTKEINPHSETGANELEVSDSCKIAYEMLAEQTKSPEGESGATESWEDLCDEDGTVDPRLIDEISCALGKVKIENTKFDYYGYRPKDVELDDNEFSHVLEAYGFPSEYKASDLYQALTSTMSVQSGQLEIQWVDDTHALVCFGSHISAREALESSHICMKLRPLSQASFQSKQKAAHLNELLRPRRPRPVTSAAAARRMVELHLGKKSSASRDQRNKEWGQIAQAKEQKQKTIRLKQEAWEGNV